MRMLTQVLILAAGIVFLIYGADFLIKGAASIARKLGISTFVVGLTVVAFGTSAPELVINVLSALQGSSGLALGNIFGSNIANTLLILGIAAAIVPISMSKGTVWKEIPFSFLASLMVLFLGADLYLEGQGPDALTRIDGLVLLSVFAIFLYYTYGISKVKSGESEQIEVYSAWKSLFFVVIGLIGLGVGGKFIVDAASFLALSAGIPESVVGATIVAVGTSLPELVTAVVAALKRHPELAVGNVVGSNIFNILFVLGTTATIAPLTYSAASFVDAALMLGAAVILFLAMFVGKGHSIGRDEGYIFLALYAGYIGYNVWIAIA